jgi:hypothetical protein
LSQGDWPEPADPPPPFPKQSLRDSQTTVSKQPDDWDINSAALANRSDRLEPVEPAVHGRGYADAPREPRPRIPRLPCPGVEAAKEPDPQRPVRAAAPTQLGTRGFDGESPRNLEFEVPPARPSDATRDSEAPSPGELDTG